MEQTSLPFHYEEENESTGMTALSGLPAYLDLAAVARLGESVRRHVGVREGTQGWTDAQMVMSLVMLNLSGGESVDPRLLRGTRVWGCCLLGSLTGCSGQTAGRSATGGAGSVAAWCRRLRRCSGISTTSTTRPRRPGGGLARRSYRRPTTRCVGLGRSTRTWSGSQEAIRDTPRRLWTWTLR